MGSEDDNEDDYDYAWPGRAGCGWPLEMERAIPARRGAEVEPVLNFAIDTFTPARFIQAIAVAMFCLKNI